MRQIFPREMSPVEFYGEAVQLCQAWQLERHLLLRLGGFPAGILKFVGKCARSHSLLKGWQLQSLFFRDIILALITFLFPLSLELSLRIASAAPRRRGLSGSSIPSAG